MFDQLRQLSFIFDVNSMWKISHIIVLLGFVTNYTQFDKSR